MGDRDTLTSVAARFDTTPSELSKLNRLGSTFIYSGQQLWVPAKGEGRTGGGSTTDAPSPDPCHDHESQDDLPPEEKGDFQTSFHLFPPFCFSVTSYAKIKNFEIRFNEQ